MKTIKRKTFLWKMNALSIFINLGDNVHLKNKEVNLKNIDCIEVKDIDDINKYDFVINKYPSIIEIDKTNEEGLELFMKLTEEINEKNQEDAIKADDVFSKKKPIITYSLIICNLIMFVLSIIRSGNIFYIDTTTLYDLGALTNYNVLGKNPLELYRLISSMFLHEGLIHLGFNMYALYILGPQIESFFGKIKFVIIYLGSGLIGGLFSMLFLGNDTIGIGASGAIFGLIGAFIYFGYHYRVYLSSVIKSQIIPLLLLNLVIGLLIPNISLVAHIGGLIGGVFTAKAVGVKYKSEKVDIINGIIMCFVLILFLIYMVGVFN